MLDAIDAVFVSYDEPAADQLYAKARQSHFPGLKRLHGVRGAGRAYALSAQMVDTDWYVLIDADCEVAADFDVLAGVEATAKADVVVWRARNPVNGLEYGYGGIKLCRASVMRELDWRTSADVLASVRRVAFLPQIGCATLFNQSRFHAWRAGFREVLVLLRGDFLIEEFERQRRLEAWLGVPADVPHARWAVAGARDAAEAYSESTGGTGAPTFDVNDAAALYSEFSSRYD
ncbi:MAG: hypothetical protein ACLP50_10870 [Solirubrobacteraceae bacterium]